MRGSRRPERVRSTTGRASAVRLAFRQLGDETPDLVVFAELFSLPFWCVGHTRQDVSSPGLRISRERR